MKIKNSIKIFFTAAILAIAPTSYAQNLGAKISGSGMAPKDPPPQTPTKSVASPTSSGERSRPSIKSSTPSNLIAAQTTAKTDSFPAYSPGSGAKYKLQVGGEPSAVTMAVISRTGERLVIEIVIESLNDSAEAGVTMWQQFHLKLVNGKIQIEKGIMKIPQIPTPQIFPNEYLQGYSGVKMKSFLINSEKDMAGKKIGDESVSSPGGSFQTSHYRHTENAQTVDFWIADDAKPFGLVKLNSAGAQFGQTYTMTFEGSVVGYTRQIDPTKAEPLNEMAKAFLPLLGPGLFSN